MSDDEVDEFNKAAENKRYRQLRGRRPQEIKMWDDWNRNGRPQEGLTKMLKSFDPMIHREAVKRTKGTGGSIPFSTVKGRLQEAATRGLQTYEPERAASLHTHVHNQFIAVTDTVSGMRNARKSSRKLTDKYQEYHNTVADLEQQHGRPPSLEEISREMKLPVSKVRQLETTFAPEAFTGMNTGVMEHDAGSMPEASRSAFLTMAPVMSEEERRFGEMMFPPAGTRQLQTKQIAQKMKIPLWKAYRIRTAVEKKLAPILKNE